MFSVFAGENTGTYKSRMAIAPFAMRLPLSPSAQAGVTAQRPAGSILVCTGACA